MSRTRDGGRNASLELEAAVRSHSALVPSVGMVLGSGLGGLADAIEDADRDPLRTASWLARRLRARDIAGG